MIKHLVLWKLKESLTAAEAEAVKADAKICLEKLKPHFKGLHKLTLIIHGLDSSTVDMCLDSEFETVEDLNNYATNPLHTNIADNYIKPYVASRSCIDYEI